MKRVVAAILSLLICLNFLAPAIAAVPQAPSPAPVGQLLNSGLLSAAPPLSHLGAAYGFMNKVRNGNRIAVMLIDSDSTGVAAHSNGSPYWPYQVGLWLCAQQPLNTVYYYTISGSSYGTPTVLCQGAGSGKVYIYNAAVSGTQLWYFFGTLFNTIFGPNSLAAPADLIVINHDKNNDYTEGQGALSGMKMAGGGWLSSFHPGAGVIVIAQHPDPINYIFPNIVAVWRAGMQVTSGEQVLSGAGAYTAGSAGTAGTTPPLCTSSTCSDGSITWTYNGVGQQMDAKVQATLQAAEVMNWEVVDNYHLYQDQINAGNFAFATIAGTAGSAYDYTVHQSIAENLVFAQNFEQHLQNLTGPLTPNQSLRQIGPNLLANGTFANMASSTTCPTSWTCNGLTVAQSTSGLPLNGLTYQLKLTNSAAGQTSMTQTISGAALTPVLGQWIHLTAFLQFINYADVTSCTIQITSNGGRTSHSYGMSAVGSYAGAVLPFDVGAFVAPTDTSVVVTVYPTFNSGTPANNGCIFDHIVLAPGLAPTDGR